MEKQMNIQCLTSNAHRNLFDLPLNFLFVKSQKTYVKFRIQFSNLRNTS